MALTTIDDRGLKTPIDLLDNEKIRLGTGNDLDIYHDGTNSYLENDTGYIYLKSDYLALRSASSENYIIAESNGAVQLYHNNVKKFETTSDGWKGADNVKGVFGDGDDLVIYHSGSNSFIQGGTGNIRIQQKVGEDGIVAIPDGAIELYHDNSKKIESFSDGVKVYEDLDLIGGTPQIKFDDTTSSGYQSYINTNNNELKIMASSGGFGVYCGTDANGASNTTQRFWVNGEGLVRLPTDDSKLQLGASQDLQIYHNGSDSYIAEVGTGSLKVLSHDYQLKNAADNETMIRAYEDGAVELYYDNSKKFDTNSTGAKCHGSQLSLVNTANTGDAKLYIEAGEGGTALIQFMADEGDNDSDKYRLLAPDAGPFKIQTFSAGAWETNLTCAQDGAVELYYNNTKKLSTDSNGVKINSSSLYIDSDSEFIAFGAGDDLKIYHDGTNSRITNTSSNDFLLDTAGDFYIRNTNTEKYIKCEANGKVELYHNNSLKLFTQSWGAQCAGNFLPDGDNSHNLGASGERWANVYSADIHLNNTGAGGNEVDGSEGSWTIQEGANDLFLLNRTNNKKYKFNLTEIT